MLPRNPPSSLRRDDVSLTIRLNWTHLIERTGLFIIWIELTPLLPKSEVTHRPIITALPPEARSQTSLLPLSGSSSRSTHRIGVWPLPPPSPAMVQYLLDIFYSLSNCLCCFPGSPQLRINSRSFRMLRLLGEVSSPSAIWISSRRNWTVYTRKSFEHIWLYLAILNHADVNFPGWLLLRLPNPRYLHLRPIRPQENPVPFRPGIRLASPQRSRTLYSLCA